MLYNTKNVIIIISKPKGNFYDFLGGSIMKKKFRLRYVLIPLAAVIAIIVIYNIAYWTYRGQIKNLETAVNSLVDERMADFYSNQNSYMPSNPDSIPNAFGNSTTSISDASDDFTDVTWPEASAPESTPAESEKITATITNYGASQNDEKHSVSIFESYDDAFDNAFVLPSGKNVNITLKANVNVESIKAIASGLNPDSGEFDEFDEFSFKSSQNSDNVYKLSFKVPNNPYGLGYKKSQVRFVAVFEIVTNEGTFYVSCAY